MRKPAFGGSEVVAKSCSSATETSYKENYSFACSKFSYTFQKANNKGVDLTELMGRLDWAFVFRKPEDRFSLVEAHYIFNFIIRGG